MVPMVVLPDIISSPQLPDATVINGSATDAPLPMAAIPDIMSPPQLPHATVINGSTTDAPLPIVALPDIIYPPIITDRSPMVALPESVLHLLSFDLLNVKQLKEQLLARQLKMVGNKAALVTRLKEYSEINETTLR